ncbi:MAG: 3D domain-containing protein [Phycisphaerales bacterium]|nr:3D domain-containing protein [Phycisphaerales bacterium]
MATRIGLVRCASTLLMVIFCGGSGQPGLVKITANHEAGIQIDSPSAQSDPDGEMENGYESDAADDESPVDVDQDTDAASELLNHYPDDAPDRAAKAERATHRKANRVCRVTAYCDRGVTASGVRSGVGQCAAPADIPLGSVVYIPSLKRHFVVTDRTHRRFRHNTVDLFIPNAGDCRQFGRKFLTCEFTIPTEPPAYGKLDLAAARRAAIAVD